MTGLDKRRFATIGVLGLRIIINPQITANEGFFVSLVFPCTAS